MALTRIVRAGTVYDGSGGGGRRADVGLEGDRVVQVSTDLPDAPGAEVVVRDGAVTPARPGRRLRRGVAG
jgi:N-acyl-D-aspartate/D-glutamate deacylase